MTDPVDLSAFHDPELMGETLRIPVFKSKTGQKPLIILHELPGMSPSFIQYCTDMTGEGFKVYMPLLHKRPGTEMGRLGYTAFCLSAEFRRLFAADRHTGGRPFTNWLLELVAAVSDENPQAKVGCVGMCMTGGFAIAAIAGPSVGAVISCQPAAPFFFGIKTLGLSEEERSQVRLGKSSKAIPCVRAYRYEKDTLCRESHMQAARELLGASFDRFPDLPGKGHSTLTTDTASAEVYQDVLSFLNERL